MPARKTPLINDQFYHILNRSINRESIFVRQKDCKRFSTTLDFYRFESPPVRLSYFLSRGVEKRKELMTSLQENSKKLVEIICFCLMPNHFHFLLKQISDEGISKFVGLVQNSYTRYFNTRHKRQGHIFQGQFKAIRIETDEQLLHLARYIHLNPHTSFVVKTLKDLEKYPWSSFVEFLGEKEGFCVKNIILSQFAERNDYRKFVFSNADYQRTLEKIKHLALDY